MSDVGERSRVSVLLADYAAADAVGKVNVLGVGWSITALNPQSGTTTPQTVVVMVDSPPDLYGEDFALSLTLRNSDGHPVEVPGPTGAPQAMRVGQNVHIDEPAFPPGTNVPRHTMWAHTQVLLNLGNGIPLPPGHLYTWSVDIDGTHRTDWEVSFFVVAPPSLPVFGGPAGPSDIPDVF